jgi:hypothetical protein
MLKFVDVETPYAGKTEDQVRTNLLYARACVRDCLLRGEIPFASHLFFTQPGILDDNLAVEREKGIVAGKELIEALPNIATVVYSDLGISRGMQYGIKRAKSKGRKVEYRTLGVNWLERELDIAKKHSHSEIWGIK